MHPSHIKPLGISFGTLALVASSLVACGGDGATGGTGGSGAGAGGDSASGATDSGSGTTGSGTTGSGSGGGAPDEINLKGGYVSVTNLVAATGDKGIVSATFTEILEPFVNSCTTTKDGACAITVCKPGSYDYELRGAGVLAMTGTTTPVTLAFNATAKSYSALVDQFIFASGAKLTVTGDGSADLPAFTIDAVAPGRATITSPDFTKTSIDRSKPLTVAWTSVGQDGIIDFQLGTYDEKTSISNNIACAFPMADGSGVVSAELLALVADGPGTMFAYEEGKGTVEAGDWSIILNANRLADGNGADGLANGSLMLP